MSSKRVLGQNMAWNTVGLAVDTVGGFVVLPFLVARLGETTYGVWIVLGALTSYFGLMDLGVRGSIGRYVALHHSKDDHAAVNRTLTGGLAVILTVAAAAVAAGFLSESLFFRFFDVPAADHDRVALAYRLVMINLGLSLLLTAFDAALWGFQRFDWLNAVDIPVTLTRVGLTFALIESGDDLVTLAWITLGATVVTGVAKGVLSFRANPRLRVGAGYLSGPVIRELLAFGSWNLIGTVARVSRRQLSPLLIGSLLGLSLVAAYSIADRLLGGVAAALTAITGVLTPFATALYATNQADRQRELFVEGGRHTCAFAAFLVAFLLALGGPLVTLWVGPGFEYVAPLLALLALGELLPGTQYVTNGILQATARHRALAVYGLFETVALCVLTVTLIPVIGLLGAGLAVAVPAFLARGVAPLVLGCRVVGVPVREYLARAIVPPLVCVAVPAGVVGFAAHAHPPATWLLFAAYGAAYTALFAVCYAGLLGPTRVKALYGEAVGVFRRPGKQPAQLP